MESLIGSNVDLKGLLDVEETIHFTNLTDLRQAIRDFYIAPDRDSLCDYTILIMGFPASSFINFDDYDDNDDDEPLLPGHGKILYLEDRQALFITMPGYPHERASRLFGRLIDRKLEAMKCADELVTQGGPAVEMNNVRKSPDESWTLSGPRYITFAVEAGASESPRALALNAKIWLEHEESHVAQVVTIKISRVREEIFFSVWTNTTQEKDTRAEHPRRASEVQMVRVTLAQERPVASKTISLSFKKLFEREPRKGTAEKDLILSKRELGEIARRIWLDMGFKIPSPAVES
ncbi:hypothetical protein OIDMADRAFT_47318 [Oidiodendron maius Zn]|uniref:Uncharacterized protein n=1 Tax=Oidiodendron maius (strain Zn) TaxID=913774 RepID=A0A0C3HWV4_OIDMZ|nr:hypothetical protein OIDMADRAFT_47318 [Oidiodendron maius Zn]